MTKSKRNSIKKLLLAVGIVGVLLSLGGCMNNNIENQKQAAVAVKNRLSGVEKIKFVQEGSVSGAGIWSVGADVEIEGKWYGIIAVIDGVSGVKAGFPLNHDHGGTKSSVKVIYSNNQEEMIE